MTLFEIFLIAISLSMDAFAVSMCKGLSVKELKIKHLLIAGIYFGVFQALMPCIGFAAGYKFENAISHFDYIISFVLLCVIGINMIKEALTEEESPCCDEFVPKIMVPLALATSIDALAVGVTFVGKTHFYGQMEENIFFVVTLIGLTTFILSMIGIKIGNVFGIKYKKKAEITGGLILICLGIKMFCQHFI